MQAVLQLYHRCLCSNLVGIISLHRGIITKGNEVILQVYLMVQELFILNSIFQNVNAPVLTITWIHTQREQVPVNLHILSNQVSQIYWDILKTGVTRKSLRTSLNE